MMGTLKQIICQESHENLPQLSQNSSNSRSSCTDGWSVRFNIPVPNRKTEYTNQNQNYRTQTNSNNTNNRYNNDQNNRHKNSGQQQNNRYNNNRKTPNQHQNGNNTYQ